MRRFLSVLAILAFTAGVGFAQTAPTTQTEKKAPAAKAEKAPKAAKTPAATGKIAKFDSATNMLTVTTKKGEETFDVSAAKITQGSKTLTAADLTNMTGDTAKVTYTGEGAAMKATAVHVTKAKAATMKKTEKKEKEEPKAEKK